MTQFDLALQAGVYVKWLAKKTQFSRIFVKLSRMFLA